MVKTDISIDSMLSNYISELEKEIKVNKVILFGSRARGNELKNSDIDLIVISEDFREMNFFERLELLELKWEYAIPIEALGYTPQEYDEMSRYIGIVAEAGKYGKVIYG